MCLVFYTSTRLSFISPMSAALSCLPYITLPSLNGLPPPDDAADDEADEQGKNMSPYLIHTGQVIGNETAEKKAEKTAERRQRKSRLKNLPLFAIRLPSSTSLPPSLPLNPVKVQLIVN